uniref:ABC transporter ATP-binding protein n=1 Tax=candidate division WOR-3 bacterium TaxID=2052148 RepID=A0A7V4E2I7_UNCW3
MAEVLIKLEKVSFSYFDDKELLTDIDLVLFKNKKIGITGKNGSGKTTLLYLIVGLLKPKKGKIEIFGKLMEKEEDFKAARKKMGFLFQNPDHQLFCPSVMEEITFGLLLRGEDKKNAKQKALEFLEIFSLKEKADYPIYQLSEGEKKRLALAEILVLFPEILILDEPTNDLDEEGKEILINFLKNPSLSAIIVSQEKSFLYSLCDGIYQLKEGKLNILH